MPLWSLYSAPASGAEAWKTSLACRRPWRAAAEVEAGRSSFLNKLAVVLPDLEDRRSLVLFFPCCRGGGKEERMRWTSRSCRFGLEQILTGGWCGLMAPAELGCGGLRPVLEPAYSGRWPDSRASPVTFLAEGQPTISSWPGCRMGGSCTFVSEFMECCCSHEGFVAPSGPSPVTAKLDLRGSCVGPNCSSILQSGVLLVKVRDLCVFSLSFESLSELCAVMTRNQ
uniref:Uncharacterized protein n=1 Tax=Aegilops tauschii subsp. strangulata TaxID=200361 RepID=A0A453SY76_AEGTS